METSNEQHNHNEDFMGFKLNTTNRLTRLETAMEYQTKILERIDVGVQKTNGRVNKLEAWKEKVLGYTIGVSGLVSLVIACAGIFIAYLSLG